jgi:hypothetical protein
VLWAQARYSLRIPSTEFYALTPRQYSLLMDAHRNRLLHAEMVQAQTTAAVVNFAFGAPEDPVNPSMFCFHLPEKKVQESAPKRYGEDEIIEWQARVANLAAEMKMGGGPMLDAIRSEANG